MKRYWILLLGFALLLHGEQTNQKQEIEQAKVDLQIPDSQSKPPLETSQTLECNLIFESRKEEIAAQIKKLEEQQQALMILQSATEGVLKEREKKLDEQYKAFEEKQKSFEDSQKQAQEELKRQEEESQKKLDLQKQAVEKLVAKNEELLQEIKGERRNKMAQTYAKMRDSKAAEILQTLPISDAVEVLSGMDVKIVGKILAKMDPQKAGEITLAIQKSNQEEKVSTGENP